jgi:hypothetical protein
MGLVRYIRKTSSPSHIHTVALPTQHLRISVLPSADTDTEPNNDNLVSFPDYESSPMGICLFLRDCILRCMNKKCKLEQDVEKRE